MKWLHVNSITEIPVLDMLLALKILFLSDTLVFFQEMDTCVYGIPAADHFSI